MSQSLRFRSVKRPARSTCAMPVAASSKVWRKRASLAASAASACLRERNWPICAPTTRMVRIRRSSGWRTMLLEIDSTPTVRPSKVTGKTQAPCTPASRTRALAVERESRLTSELHTGSPLVQPEIAAAVPVLRLADRLHHRAQRVRDALRIGEIARHRVLERKETLLAPAVRHIAADAAVAEEFAARGEHRLAADGEEPCLAIRVDAPDLEVAERLARIQRRPVRRPAGRIGMDRRYLPAGLAQHRSGGRALFLRTRGARDAVLDVGLPVEVGRERSEEHTSE